MRRIALISMATVVAGTCAFFITRKVHSQTAFSSRPEFLMTLVEKRFDPANGAPIYEEVSMRGSRGDAVVHVVRRAHPTGGWVEMKAVIDLRTGKRVVIDPLTESVTTYNLSTSEIARYANHSATCGVGAGSPTTTHAGYETFQITQTITDPQRPRYSEQWVSPVLNCFPLREALVDSTTGQVLTLREAQFVVVGRPPDSLFAIPDHFTERSPSEVFAELARRYPGRHPASVRTGMVLDQAYDSHQ